MFGTDLQQAYDQNLNTEPQNMMHLNTTLDMDREVEQKQSTIQQQHQQHHQHQQEDHQQPNYETNSFFRDNQMQTQLSQLQEELRLQKHKAQSYKTSTDINIIDRFVSKKKDVIKLVLISLTIVLAFSLHYVINDILKAYIMNSILTPTQEMLTKLSYPVTILLIIWTIKVFNK